MKIAIVADWIYGGGAEKVVQELHHMYPDAPIYTSYCSPEWRQKLDNKVVTGYLQWPPFARARKFLPLLVPKFFRFFPEPCQLLFPFLDLLVFLLQALALLIQHFLPLQEPFFQLLYLNPPLADFFV